MIFIAYVKLIRWKNLVLIAYTFYLVKFQLFDYYNITTNLTQIQFYQLLFSVLLITAGGYIINDIYDLKTDKINNPDKLIVSNIISIEKAKRWYLFTNSFGLVLGIHLCLTISKPSLSVLFIATSLLLYYYSKKFKGIPFLGNFIVSVLICLSFGLLVFFDLNFLNSNPNNETVLIIIGVLIFFAFFLNLIREIIKDIEDVNGDNQLKSNSLPLIFGRKRIKYLASYLCMLPILLSLIIVCNYIEINPIFSLFLLLGTGIPLIYVSFKLRSINSKKEFHKLSTLLKVIMLLGISSLLLFLKFQ